eukprot:CAMPEP_0195523036 /NCGR_PEP_ID=MMETSP0794_2-20130614/21794_1 /TAXON_ID=515487 /ORGANISM="Stephanopyxis turris, Strain CCMP 815" /LENGTH=199 /DNA_ID=CAMNT_0040652937 /DNA_START=187 /DNA_END=787 /DNA_ORIENTATION=-
MVQFCQEMEKDFEKLYDEWSDVPDVLIAEVDCHADGKGQKICNKYKINTLPMVKWGSTDMSLENYDYEYTLEAMNNFGVEFFVPMCSVTNVHLCDDETKAFVDMYKAMKEVDLDAAIAKAEDELLEALVIADEKEKVLREIEQKQVEEKGSVPEQVQIILEEEQKKIVTERVAALAKHEKSGIDTMLAVKAMVSVSDEL